MESLCNKCIVYSNHIVLYQLETRTYGICVCCHARYVFRIKIFFLLKEVAIIATSRYIVHENKKYPTYLPSGHDNATLVQRTITYRIRIVNDEWRSGQFTSISENRTYEYYYINSQVSVSLLLINFCHRNQIMNELMKIPPIPFVPSSNNLQLSLNFDALRKRGAVKL